MAHLNDCWLFAFFFLCFPQFTTQMLINRLTPKPDQGFQVQVNLIPNEPFWLCFGYVPANSTHHHSFRWDKCTDERNSLTSAHGFAYTLHAEWELGRLNIRFWRSEITDQDHMLVHNAHIEGARLTITHARGITAITDNTIKYSSIVRAIEAPIPMTGGRPITKHEIAEHKLDTLHVLDKHVEVTGIKDRGVLVIGNGRGIHSMQLVDA